MGKTAHTIFVSAFTIIVIATTIILISKGTSYYSTDLAERFYHPDHDLFKPSGLWGHGLGIVGTLLILFGVLSYMARKRSKLLARVGLIKHWLEFHIFLCTLGPIMVLFHTAFKFQGIVSISFWSMIAVVASGVLGRFIYIQIPRTLEGRELSLQEVKEMRENLSDKISTEENVGNNYNLAFASAGVNQIDQKPGNSILSRYIDDYKAIAEIKRNLKREQINKKERRHIIRLIKNERSLNRRIGRLLTMQKLFRYWHVAHLPFAIVMLIIMVVHVLVTVTFGNTWIF